MNAAKLSKVEHREFEIQFEDVGFTTSDLSGRVLSESEAAGFTETATKEKTLPAGVVAIVGGYITDDDGQGDKIGKKVFLCIKLRVLAVDEDAAEAFTPPRALLATLADMMVRDGEGNIDLDLEGNWEVSEGSAELVGSVHDDVRLEGAGIGGRQGLSRTPVRRRPGAGRSAECVVTTQCHRESGSIRGSVPGIHAR
ncbi:hypothetical protein [Pandoraea soli]